jgi:tetratricopeptide (TPR) repeat protein
MVPKKFGFLESAMQKLTKGKAAPDKETDKYEAALKENPNNAEALNALGDIYAKQGVNEKAKDHYVKAGRLFAENGFTLKAIAVYKKAQRAKPDSADTYVELANLYVQKGLIGDAKANYLAAAELLSQGGAIKDSLDVFRRAIDLDPDNLTLREKLAERYERSNLFEEASSLYLDIANSYIGQGMLREGTELYKKVTELQPANVDAQFELASLCFEQNLLDAGIQVLDKIQEQNPDSTSILERVADIYIKIRKLDKVAIVYQRLIELDPSNEEYQNKLRVSFSSTQPRIDMKQVSEEEFTSLNFGEEAASTQRDRTSPETEERTSPKEQTPLEFNVSPSSKAEPLSWPSPVQKKESEVPSEDFGAMDLPEGVSLTNVAPEAKPAVPSRSESGSVYFDLAARLDTSLRISREYETRSVESESPSDSAIHMKVGSISRGSGDNVGDIIKEFKKSVLDEVGEEDYETHYELGIAYKEMNLFDDAIDEFKLASLSPGKYVECCSMIGACYAEKGDYNQAIAQLNESLGKSGLDAEQRTILRYELARIYEMAGQPNKAVPLYVEIYRADPKFMDVAQRLKQFKR